MKATSSLGASATKGFVWQMDEDGAIRQTMSDYQFGGTPIFSETVREHNGRVLDESA